MADVRFEAATKTYAGNPIPAVNRLSLHVEDGEFMVLVGPSGSGKSTALRILAGLEHLDEGAVLIGDRDVSRLSPGDRDIAMVFQDYALYPHMTVADNMGFALRIARVGKAERQRQVAEAARVLNLELLLDRRPKQLSGGQRQRVAMGRALVRDPQAFLMDEPLSNLDAQLRVQTRAELAALQRRLNTTTVYVTHDQVEAMTMGDRVAVMHDGELQQVDSPRALYATPENAFVASFIGSPPMNLIKCQVSEDGARFGSRRLPVPCGRTSILIGVRPEDFELVAPDQGLRCTVDLIEDLGADSFLHGVLDAGGGAQTVVARLPSGARVAVDEVVSLAPAAAVHLFDDESGDRLDA